MADTLKFAVRIRVKAIVKSITTIAMSMYIAAGEHLLLKLYCIYYKQHLFFFQQINYKIYIFKTYIFMCFSMIR